MKTLSIMIVTNVLVLYVLSCASMQSNLTYEQRLYALQSEYMITADVAVSYVERQDTDETVKQTVKDIHEKVLTALRKAREQEDYFTLAQEVVLDAKRKLKTLLMEDIDYES